MSGRSSRPTSSMMRQGDIGRYREICVDLVHDEAGGAVDTHHLDERAQVDLHARVLLAPRVAEHVHLLEQLELQRLRRVRARVRGRRTARARVRVRVRARVRAG